jgi:dihydroorotate dehydrogenase
MRRYPGRRLFMALPPEAAHRLANAVLALPLPWRRIGGDVPDDPRLAVALAGIQLRNPIGLAAGFDKACRHLDHLGELGFGYIVGGTITREPRTGNPRPRIVRRPAELALVNAMGMPNPGAARAVASLARSPRTSPRLVSLADEEVADVVAAAEALEPHVDGFELNASSPNAGWRHGADRVARVVEELRRRTTKPILVKLPPAEAAEDGTVAMAIAAREAGAEGLTCSNTRPVEDRGLSTGRGGLSGRPLFEGTLRIVREVREATGLPVNASGGVFTAADALACLEAGATTVQVYTGMVYEGPGIVGALARGLAADLAARDTSISALVR